jgi:hypothetical protein
MDNFDITDAAANKKTAHRIPYDQARRGFSGHRMSLAQGILPLRPTRRGLFYLLRTKDRVW